jgi:hypothetical protein
LETLPKAKSINKSKQSIKGAAMRKLLSIHLFLLICLSSIVVYGQSFFRIGELPLAADETGFGNFISGVDFDGDGLMEIYAVNNNWNDDATELIPKIWKYEYDGELGWDVVWSATLDIPAQNTWPALTYGDMDEDGKMEVIWGPVNYTGPANLNPARVVVFETMGNGSDSLGVDDGAGNFLPNAEWTITTEENFNLRPFKWVLNDFDGDGDQELIYVSRVNSVGPGNRFGIVSVDNIPDNGDGSETWTIEMSDTAGTNVSAGTLYDLAVMNETLYLLHDNGDVTPVTYSGGTYTIEPVLAGLIPGGTWKTASVVDLDNDTVEEAVVGNWSTGARKVYLLQGTGAAATATEIADFSSLIPAGRINGGAAGDIDQDGNMDFVFGTRDATPNAAIIRMEYQGGDITSAASYTSSIIDQEYAATGGRWMNISIGNIDQDDHLEVLYSDGIGEASPIVILDVIGQIPVELTSFSASVVDGAVQLNWSTATEQNNRGFEVQRKSVNEKFVTIGFVEGKGTTTQTQSYSYNDNIAVGAYAYRLKQIDYDGTYELSDIVEIDLTGAPSEFTLSQNYPNPFNPTTSIKFELAKESNVTLRIYNTLGEEVTTLLNNEIRSAGVYNLTFDASTLASGTYIYRLQAGDVVLSKKMILAK